MALHGTLMDIPLCDLLSMVGKSRGVLEIENPNTKFKALFQTADNMIVAMCAHCKTQPDLSEATVESILIDFLNQPEASFEFRREERLHNGIPVSLRIDVVLLECMSRWDEMRTLRPDLPHPDTVFMTDAADILIVENIELEEFWLLTRPLFVGGCSAREIAAILNLDLDDSLVQVEKLCKLGVLKPVRLFDLPVDAVLPLPNPSAVVGNTTTPTRQTATDACCTHLPSSVVDDEINTIELTTNTTGTVESSAPRKAHPDSLRNVKPFEPDCLTLTKLIHGVMHALRPNAVTINHGS
jgi:hypothetical protein